MELPWANRNIDAVAAHGSNSMLKALAGRVTGVVDLTAGLVPEDDERCLASCPVDMAKASQSNPRVR